MSVLSILGLIFITLKLCNVITWSWIWVLCPFWIGFAIVLLIFLVTGSVYFFERVMYK